MSVFTPIQRNELESFLFSFELGRLLAFREIAEGTENSNFFVSLDTGEYVLTLVERGAHTDLPFTVRLLHRLHQAGLPVPFAICNKHGQAIQQLAGKPAMLQPRLAGRHILQPHAQHCAEVGKALAHMHLATREQPVEHPSDRGLAWMLEQGAELSSYFAGSSLALLNETLHAARELQYSWQKLPQANLHADLFRDNVLFEGACLSGMIDFYNACSGPMLYDVAITVMDWCTASDGALDARLMGTLLAAYAGLRAFTRAEELHWAAMLQVACLRFWLSRVLAAGNTEGSKVQVKAPVEFEQRLQKLRDMTAHLPMAL